MMPQTTQNESALVRAARAGNKEALRLLLMRNWMWLRALVFSIVSDGHDLDDILQDICVRVISRIAGLREPERFRPWLATLARRQALCWRRRKNQRPVSLTEDAANQRCDDRARQLFENIEQQEQYRQLLSTAKSLPEKYRRVFMLKYATDLTYGQVGEILDIPVTTVQIRLVRARRMIRERLTDKNNVSER
ncbi:MAG: RNA polymerase sigma factor [Planctomycetota bacterium]|jgi:RNA polymerase sigma-70 factor (ECF subfamily)